MIIDYTQSKEMFEVSYVDENGQIQLTSIPLNHGYYSYTVAEPWETNDLIPNLLSFKNKNNLKRTPAKYFDNHNINEFLNFEVAKEHPEIYSKISAINIPKPFSVDIETEITDETGYSTALLAENRILSISITDVNIGTILFEIRNPNKPDFTDEDKMIINSYLETSLGHYYQEYQPKFDIRIFDSEVEMINTFLECINKYFHSIMGWNFELYDWPYIYNRCIRLGIDVKKASPNRKVTKKSIVTKKDKKNPDNTVRIDTMVPTHRIIIDYMFLFKSSLVYNNLGSYSLNSIAESQLGLNKVMYDGNLRSLYENDYNKFRAYALIDTILVMLIHKKVNLYDIDFFEAYKNKIAFAKISQNSISEALVYNKLRSMGYFLPTSEYNVEVKREYEGGYVKTPTKKLIDAGKGLDFSGLYPNSINTCGLSPELKIDSINVDKLGRPKTQQDELVFNKYIKQNCLVTPNGRVYSKDSEGLFPSIEKDLINERKIFKGHVADIYLNLSTRIKNRIKELENNESDN